MQNEQHGLHCKTNDMEPIDPTSKRTTRTPLQNEQHGIHCKTNNMGSTAKRTTRTPLHTERHGPHWPHFQTNNMDSTAKWTTRTPLQNEQHELHCKTNDTNSTANRTSQHGPHCTEMTRSPLLNECGHGDTVVRQTTQVPMLGSITPTPVTFCVFRLSSYEFINSFFALMYDPSYDWLEMAIHILGPRWYSLSPPSIFPLIQCDGPLVWQGISYGNLILFSRKRSKSRNHTVSSIDDMSQVLFSH